jgi:hypothetical protein
MILNDVLDPEPNPGMIHSDVHTREVLVAAAGINFTNIWFYLKLLRAQKTVKSSVYSILTILGSGWVKAAR